MLFLIFEKKKIDKLKKKDAHSSLSNLLPILSLPMLVVEFRIKLDHHFRERLVESKLCFDVTDKYIFSTLNKSIAMN